MDRGIRRTAMAAGMGAALVLSMTSLAGAAEAATWQCRGSALYASVAGNNRIEPVVANGNPNTAGGASADQAECANADVGLNNLATPLGIPIETLQASTLTAQTRLEPVGAIPADQRVTAIGRIENLKLRLPLAVIDLLGVGVANAQASASCQGGNPVLAGSSQLTGITVNGTTVSADNLVETLSAALAPLAPIVDVKVNEQVRDATSLTHRALHVKLLNTTGTPLLDLVVGEAKAGFTGAVCDRSGQQPDPVDPRSSGPCPLGSLLDVASNLCVIRREGRSDIIVAAANEGPIGGIVMALDEAAKKYRSACTKGSGPKFAIIGTNGPDRITGTNKRDRIIARGGKDRVDGGRSGDCIDGGTGRDTLSGGLGADRVYGTSGNDAINGGANTDLLSGGVGNDTINAAFGRDRVLGGAGRDAINVATSGPPARVSCGGGRDKVRVNYNERNRTTGCETRYVFRDRKSLQR